MASCLFESLCKPLGFQSFTQSIHHPLRGLNLSAQNHPLRGKTLNQGMSINNLYPGYERDLRARYGRHIIAKGESPGIHGCDDWRAPSVRHLKTGWYNRCRTYGAHNSSPHITALADCPFRCRPLRGSYITILILLDTKRLEFIELTLNICFF